VIAVEAAIGVNAYLASMNPRIYGGVGLALFPILMQPTTTEAWLAVGALETVPIYNLTIDPDEKSPSQIFKANFVAWHVAAGLLATTGYLTKDKKVSLSYMPERGGGKVVFAYRY